ncbi:hypothetical protein MOTE_18670 [Moorella thermoacetica]|uniref:Transposase DDE domain-containing protein n=1 Tax=Neomoorella thermoacetica TaxID=1525 RepID=A0A1J5NHG7_NEOTH|nr:hypothetical protein MOTE_18670 [Moorella thermoacetica]
MAVSNSSYFAAFLVALSTLPGFSKLIKNDLDLERLPSGKFATNDLVLHLGVFAYNILRLLGQFSLSLKEELLATVSFFKQAQAS